MKKPIIGITMGDAAGIGPEIIVKALHDEAVYAISNPIVIGDLKMLEKAKKITGTPIEFKAVSHVNDATFTYGVAECIDLDLLPYDLPYGEISAVAGNAAFKYLEKAIQLAKDKEISAICTAPLNKEALHKGGHNFPGHTEILASLTNTKEYSMMLSSPQFKVIHVTTHVGLIDAIQKINPERVYKVIKLAHETLFNGANKKPRIAVCAINPHAGENGLFGHGEEEEKIIPAIERSKAEGMDVYGPIPADTVFYSATQGQYDIVVAMYHDQGHAPLKVLGLEDGVNITVGLPIIRTSVDHGTAFNIAGKGIASYKSLLEAIKEAVYLIPKNENEYETLLAGSSK